MEKHSGLDRQRLSGNIVLGFEYGLGVDDRKRIPQMIESLEKEFKSIPEAKVTIEPTPSESYLMMAVEVPSDKVEVAKVIAERNGFKFDQSAEI